MTDAQELLSGLNPDQRQAAEAVGGPVAILAGAGTGKTTTITRRIAYQVASGAMPANHILAVTFTEKAAGELKHRLASLGVEGVEARTFHAAALFQLGRLWERHTGQALPKVLPTKAAIVARLADRLPMPHKFIPRRELAGEIERAKNQMVTPDGYMEHVESIDHEPPIPAELMQRVFEGYERAKTAGEQLDFEDMLGLGIRLIEEYPAAAEIVRDRYRSFTVDEYQDVNPLQQRLLDAWLGGRNEVCVVGDDYQTIYSFTGASPKYLLGFAQRFPGASIIKLRENYRSTPQVLAVANRLVPRLGGFEKVLTPVLPDGPEPRAHPFKDSETEMGFVVEKIKKLRASGVPDEEIAVLYRINARSEPFEEALADAGIAYQVRDGAFLGRPGAKSVLAALRRLPERADVGAAVIEATEALGWKELVAADDAEEITRQADMSRMRALAKEYEERLGATVGGAEGAGPTVTGFVTELRQRFSVETSGRGVNLMTYHRAKGLEFEAVFLPGLMDGELPFKQGRAEADPQEERRLFYVGITRAKRHLFVSWTYGESKKHPSRFLAEIDFTLRPAAKVPSDRKRPAVDTAGGGADAMGDADGFARLKQWRLERAKQDAVPAYVIFHDRTLMAIAERGPKSLEALSRIPGVGPAKLERYGDEVLSVLAES